MAKSNPRLAEQASEQFVEFLRSVLEHGAQRRLGNQYASLTTPPLRVVGDPPEARGAITWLNRLLTQKPAPYPMVQTVWDMSRALCALGPDLAWLLPPVLYYAAGQMEAFVEVVATVKFDRINGPHNFRNLVRDIPDAIKGVPSARAGWQTLEYQARHAFLPPALAREKFGALLAARDNAKCNLRIAHTLSTDYDLPLEARRGVVFDFLLEWISDLASRPESFGI